MFHADPRLEQVNTNSDLSQQDLPGINILSETSI